MRAAGRDGQGAFRKGRKHHGGKSAAHGANPARHGRRLSLDARRHDRPGMARAAHARAPAQIAAPLDRSPPRDHLMAPTVHIIGAALAGLSAAARLAAIGARVAVYEATNQAGGRCRSYHDPALDMTIDNGNHLVLSGNHAVLGYLDTIGARDGLVGPGNAHFPFVDLETGERWTIRPNDGPLGWWVLARSRRVPGTRALD